VTTGWEPDRTALEDHLRALGMDTDHEVAIVDDLE
jgi:hypothetical protein